MAAFSYDFTTSDRDRFFAKVSKSENGCWMWTGSTGNAGYGCITFPKSSYRSGTFSAHRVSYVMHVGPIGGDLFVCHRCDTPLCVNPEHLFLGTHADNMRDCVLKGRRTLPPASVRFHKGKVPHCGVFFKQGSLHDRAKLTEQAVRDLRDGSLTIHEACSVYGVEYSVAYKARQGYTWKHLDGHCVNSTTQVPA